jgi:pimeloyl-ACP methyl ester carboxylesterase
MGMLSGTAGRFDGLHYVQYGTGRPVIALHGFGQTAYSWRHLVAALQNGLALYVFDLRGCGESEKPRDERYSLPMQAAQICAFIRHFDLQNVTLVGHSMGGGVALLAALALMRDQYDRLHSLVLIDGLVLAQGQPLFMRVARNPVLGPLMMSCLPPRFMIRFVLWQAFYDRHKIDDRIVAAYAINLATDEARYALAQTARQIIPPDLDAIVRRYEEISVPTLIIWGERDRIVPLRNGHALHAKIRSSSMTVIPSCGHIPHEERPDVTIPEILDFLSGRPRAKSLGVIASA